MNAKPRMPSSSWAEFEVPFSTRLRYDFLSRR
jgi:hypothetical protein